MLPPDVERGRRLIDDERTKVERFKEKFVDRYAPVESVQDEVGGVKEVVGKDGYTDHTKSTDFVAAADKANGREEHEMRSLGHKSAEIDRGLAAAALKGQSTADLLNDFDLYLQCRHAAERNRTIAERNGVDYDADYYYGMGRIPLPGGKSVGLSENVANRLLNGQSGKYGSLDKFDAVAQKVYEINRADIQRRVEAGRLTPQEANQYLYRWKNYVPLKTDMQRLEPDAFNSSTASMRKNEFMKAHGRANADIADSPLAASILQAEQGIRGSIRNELMNVGANLVEHAAEEGKPIGEIVRGEMLPKGAGWTFTLSDGTKGEFNVKGVEMVKLGKCVENGGEDDNHVKVGSFMPNKWGLYDMHGNVWELCKDLWGKYPDRETDPIGAKWGGARVTRGGGWNNGAGGCRSWCHGYVRPQDGHATGGFRLACPAETAK